MGSSQVQSEKILSAQALYDKSSLIIGTQAEDYLSRRGLSSSCGDIRYLSSGTKFNDNGSERTVYNGALLSGSRDSSGTIVGVQLVYLKDDCKQLDRDGNSLSKFQYGVFKDSLLSLSDSKSSVAVVSEGLETSLSLHCCMNKKLTKNFSFS